MAFTPSLTFEKVYPLTIFWCCAPLAWGVWALLTPSAWMPKRLPLWGALLGLFAGSMAAFVLNLPSRFLGGPTPILVRVVAVLVLTLFYYMMWMMVRSLPMADRRNLRMTSLALCGGSQTRRTCDR